jgi:hypothetical protein
MLSKVRVLAEPGTNMDSTIKTEILAAFLSPKRVNIEDIPHEDPQYKKLKEMENYVTTGVDYLRSQFPNEVVRKLMARVWDVFNKSIVPCAVGPSVPTVSFAAVGSVANLRGLVLLPHDWLVMIKADPIMQMGALVFTGSQAYDFSRSQFINKTNDVIARARAYEAEYLKTVQQQEPDWRPNEYQRSVLRNYPRGIHTDGMTALIEPELRAE